MRTSRSTKPLCRLFPLSVVLILTASMAAVGCGPKDSPREEAAEGVSTRYSGDVISAYELTISAESSPQEVAQMLIKALDNKDGELLITLCAVKEATEEVNRIGRGRLTFTPAKAAKLAAVGWLATYFFYEPGQTEVVDEDVQDGTAVVHAMGRHPETKKGRKLEIRFKREDEWWKVLPGLKDVWMEQ